MSCGVADRWWYWWVVAEARLKSCGGRAGKCRAMRFDVPPMPFEQSKRRVPACRNAANRAIRCEQRRQTSGA